MTALVSLQYYCHKGDIAEKGRPGCFVGEDTVLVLETQDGADSRCSMDEVTSLSLDLI